MHATTVAIDLAKDVFELAFADARQQVTTRKRLGRAAFARCLQLAPPCTVLMEACGSAHYWGRRFVQQGHTVRLLPARDVRPYVRRNKTDRADAAGLLEADRCADVFPVPIKSVEQQGIQALHRVREQLKAQRTATLNLLRGVLREFGIITPNGAARVAGAVRAAVADDGNDLPPALRATLAEQLEHSHLLALQMRAIEARLTEFAQRDVASARYLQAPGIGLLTATALSASVGDLQRFRSGRHFAAWLGLPPREHSSGRHRHLGPMSKRGDAYLRTLLIHGARAVLRAARVHQQRGTPLNPLQQWGLAVQQRCGHNKAAVALANKLARRLFAMVRDGRPFDPHHVSRRPQAAA